jgi:hypothetical protein
VTRSLLVLIALASLAHANPGKPDGEDQPPKVTRTQLTLQLGKAKPAKALVQHADVEHPRMMQPCPVHLTLTLQHPKVKTVELSFTYGNNPKKNTNLPLAIVGAEKPGKVDVTFKKQGAAGLQTLVTKLDAPFDVSGVKVTLRGTVEIANTTCAFDAI